MPDTSLATLTGTYTIDPTHSTIGFVARHAMVTKVRGAFNEFEGSGYFDGADPENSRLELRIQAKSIGLEGRTTVNRKDWGVNWNAALEAGGVLVSEKVVLEFDVSAIRTDNA